MALSWILILQISILYGGGSTVSVALEEKKVLLSKNESKDIFRTFGIGMGRIGLGNDFHKSFSTASKIGSKYDIYNMYLFRNGNTYKHLSENHGLSIIGLGFSTNSFTHDDITLGIGLGLGMNLLTSKLFTDFKESFDFGFAYTLEIDYALNNKWSALLTYNKYNLNTNVLQIEDTKPDIFTLNIIYAFDM